MIGNWHIRNFFFSFILPSHHMNFSDQPWKMIKYYLARNSGLKIHDSGFEIQDWKIKYENLFQKELPDFRISKYVSTILLLSSFYFTQKFALSYAGFFHKNSLIVTCCTFSRFEIRTLTPNRLKNQTDDTLTLLGHNYNHQRGNRRQKIFALHRCGFNFKFTKHF